MARISTLVLTYNEEIQIERCLRSVIDLTDDIVVVDSFSTDSTVDICKRYNCRIYQNKFINHGKQINWALDTIEFKWDWILVLDSDEVIPDKLKEEIGVRVGNEDEYVGYFFKRRIYWMNRWLRYGRMYPHYIIRLFRKEHGRYEEREEDHLILRGRAGIMQNDSLEDNRGNTLSSFMLKHLRTAENEVNEILHGFAEDEIQPKLFGLKPNRNRWLKVKIYSRLPLFARPFFYFVYRYIFCLGFLDGKEGLVFHVLQGFWYRFYIDSRVYEEKNKWQKNSYDYSKI
jgi:glycosyltransferase involved in cell wall biosynthesis